MRLRSSPVLAALGAALLSSACTDVGDDALDPPAGRPSDAAPLADGGADVTVRPPLPDAASDARLDGVIDGGADATMPGSGCACSDAAADAASDAGAPDAATHDAGASDAAVSDAAVSDGGAGDAGAGDTGAILGAKSPACLACARASGCIATADLTCEGLTGVAAAGPAAGAPRAQLCRDALGCVLPSKCAAGGTGTPCYCGTAKGTACLTAGNANGVCKSQEERGLETTDPSVIATGFGDPSKGAGVANTLVQCLNDNACTDCF